MCVSVWTILVDVLTWILMPATQALVDAGADKSTLHEAARMCVPVQTILVDILTWFGPYAGHAGTC